MQKNAAYIYALSWMLRFIKSKYKKGINNAANIRDFFSSFPSMYCLWKKRYNVVNIGLENHIRKYFVRNQDRITLIPIQKIGPHN